jgi:bleomycin hydrolase
MIGPAYQPNRATWTPWILHVSLQQRQNPPPQTIMGTTPSKPTITIPEPEKFESSIVTRDLTNLTLNDSSTKPWNTLDTSLFPKWEHRLLSDPKNQLALSAFTQGDMLNLIRKREAVINDDLQLYSNKIEVEGRPVTNQRSSGRCWLFASTNVMRVGVIKKYIP